jgi:hypothetical protein
MKQFNIEKQDFYQFGIDETKLPPIDLVDEYWEKLKCRILNNEKVNIRGYGRDANGTQLYLDLYKNTLGNSKVEKDSTNNAIPNRIISTLTGLKRNKHIYNYQISHIFGRTKNIFLFEAPWNIAYIPKIIDPFTGHETKGIWPIEFREMFVEHIKGKYQKYIDDYNQLLIKLNYKEKVKEYVNDLKNINGETKIILQFEKDVNNEFSEI